MPGKVTRYAIQAIAVLMIAVPIERAGVREKPTSLIVEEVAADSPAAKAGLKVDDRILAYDPHYWSPFILAGVGTDFN